MRKMWVVLLATGLYGMAGWARSHLAPVRRADWPRMQQPAAEPFVWGPLAVPGPLHERLAGAGYHKPMPIQCEAMPLIAQGENVILHAATGSGKTVAFLAPLLANLDHSQGLQAIIVSPSQELAVQIASEARLLHDENAVLLALSAAWPPARCRCCADCSRSSLALGWTRRAR